jgi:hypothetical protein
VPAPRPRQGDVLRAIKLVLADQPCGLRTVEVRRRAELLLGRKLPRSTVKGRVADNRGFQRINRGICRLRSGQP